MIPETLTDLDLSPDQLQTLPAKIGRLITLVHLNIRNDSLQTLPSIVPCCSADGLGEEVVKSAHERWKTRARIVSTYAVCWTRRRKECRRDGLIRLPQMVTRQVIKFSFDGYDE